MGIVLSEYDKLIVIIIAAILILVTLISTICLVSPWCYLYKLFIKRRRHKKTFKSSYPSVNANIAESQHFHLSIVPVYGTKICSPTTEISNVTSMNNQFEHLTNLAEKARICYSNANNNTSGKQENNNNVQMNLAKIEAMVYYKVISDSTIKICIKIQRVYDIEMRELQSEPSPYVVAILSGYRSVHRKSIIVKALQNELFRTETVKRTTDATFVDQEFISEELPKNLIKEASIKLKLMNEERYANDVCLGEINIPLKKIRTLDEMNEMIPNNSKMINLNDNIESKNIHQQKSVYTMFPIKEIKGELLVGFCYLPTSRRVNVTIIKGNIRSSQLRTNVSTNHQAFYIKALMFYNGKLIKKKKTSLSIRLSWGNNKAISFDLPDDDPNENISFMVILAYKLQNSNSPESPESPENPTTKMMKDGANESDQNSNQAKGTTRKENCIGHFQLDKLTWIEEILKKPRNQSLKWYKLY